MDKHEGRDAGTIRLDDPWQEEPATGWDGAETARPRRRRTSPTTGARPGPEPTAPPGPRGGTADAGAAGAPAGADAPADPAADGLTDAARIYLEVQRSPAFQEVRRNYRRFVVPATAGFLLWYLGYVVAATAVPELMSRPVFGAVNVALLAGLAQFLTTFALTWAYARHARLRRDRVALDLRWSVFEQERDRGRARSAAAETRPEAGA
ncbi:DUF485 domain-containing protein [Streptomyces sp. BI20]|uniref:DUF485 domain-containing protein n=1 Tax=Streptomyces sp. BI20 TaxID=3403460 RepID=UPI003C763265